MIERTPHIHTHPHPHIPLFRVHGLTDFGYFHFAFDLFIFPFIALYTFSSLRSGVLLSVHSSSIYYVAAIPNVELIEMLESPSARPAYFDIG